MANRRVNIPVPRLDYLIPRIQIRDNGNWVKLDNLTVNLTKAVQLGYDSETERFARSIKRIVQRAIRSGSPPPNSGVTWRPLSPKTIRRHGPHAIYYLTGQYSRAIDIYRYKSRTLVGLPIGVRHMGKGRQLTLNQLAIMLEFGNNHIPPRPLWSPSLSAYGGTKKLKANMMKAIRKQIISRTGLSANQIRMRW